MHEYDHFNQYLICFLSTISFSIRSLYSELNLILDFTTHLLEVISIFIQSFLLFIPLIGKFFKLLGILLSSFSLLLDFFSFLKEFLNFRIHIFDFSFIYFECILAFFHGFVKLIILLFVVIEHFNKLFFFLNLDFALFSVYFYLLFNFLLLILDLFIHVLFNSCRLTILFFYLLRHELSLLINFLHKILILLL